MHHYVTYRVIDLACLLIVINKETTFFNWVIYLIKVDWERPQDLILNIDIFKFLFHDLFIFILHVDLKCQKVVPHGVLQQQHCLFFAVFGTTWASIFEVLKWSTFGQFLKFFTHSIHWHKEHFHIISVYWIQK